MKGAEGKAYAIRKIAEAFGENYVGEFDKKIYINCPEGGGLVQLALSITCPKTPIGNINEDNGEGMNFDSFDLTSNFNSPTDISDDEKRNLEKLMKELGLA